MGMSSEAMLSLVALALVLAFTPVVARRTLRSQHHGELRAEHVRHRGASLAVEMLHPGVWVHTSHHAASDVGTHLPSNGLVVQHGDSVWLVDTAWGDDLTVELLDWVERELRLPVAGAIISHVPAASIGGAEALACKGIPSWAHPVAARTTQGQGGDSVFAPLPELTAGDAIGWVGGIEIFYPGRGYRPGNLMVWLEQQRLLYGGCALRPLTATCLGNIKGADLAEWPRAIRRAKSMYGNARVIVPGHGPLAGPSLLDHTLLLLEGRA